MTTDFKLPELGENIESADILNVLVKEGDVIKKDQSVIEIETDKATIEVPSTVEGTIKSVKVKAGDKVKVGQVLISVESSNGSQKETKTEPPQRQVKESKPESKKIAEAKTTSQPETKVVPGKTEIVEFKLPDLGENIESADVLNILVKVGDSLSKDQGILEIETDKATIEVPSSLEGTVKEVLIKAGDKAKVGQTIIKVEVTQGTTVKAEQKEDKPKPAAKEEEQKFEPVSTTDSSKGEREKVAASELDEQPPIQRGSAPAAPSVRRIARELGIDINKVPGSGPSGRISMDDVKSYVKKLNEERASGGSFGFKQEPLPDFTKYGNVDRKPFSKIRAKTAEHLSYAWATIPHVTQFDKADITLLEKARVAFNPKAEKAGGKLTMTSVLLKVIGAALKEFPQFNSSIDMEKQEVIYKNYFNVGIAVDTEHGLIVPVVKNVNQKNLIELSVEMTQLAEKARTRKISIEEMQGGCFTITNLGGIGGTSFTPIVNAPEVAILGVSRGKMEPVYRDNKFDARLMLPLSLSYDHRIIDGADAARFLRWVVEALEEPMKLLL
ncbi:MAG: dihydrolipoyllysine-residue acetyltransferase [Ignavibacteriales bacterium]|nr:MAG: dihydrolipoyllysine-residue acetyltransferase [Ignavibacteriales bacterium]